LYKKARQQALGEEESKDNKSKDKPKAKETAHYGYTDTDDCTL
jgi:hypothetical protein